MSKKPKIPEAVLDRAAELGFDQDKTKASVMLDRSRDNVPCDCYVFFDGASILFLWGINVLRKKEKRKGLFGK